MLAVADRSIPALLRQGAQLLAESGNPNAERDAGILLGSVLGDEPAGLPLFERELSQHDVSSYERLLVRRRKGEPVAYLVGEQGFWSLDFVVDRHTLIPRPDTETLVEVALELIETVDRPRILDLGTGSGCVLLSILAERGDAIGVGVDVSSGALDVAAVNAVRNGLLNRARFLLGDWYKALEPGAQFDLIVSNPPYIPSADIAGLMQDVRDHEPWQALDGGEDGLECYRTIFHRAGAHLKPGGVIAVEVGMNQAADVTALLTASGVGFEGVRRDLTGIERVVSGKKSS